MLNYEKKAVRAAAILTDSYVAGTIVQPDLAVYSHSAGQNQLTVMIAFTIGSLTSAQVKVEFSDDGTTYYQDTNASTSWGTTTLSLGEYSFSAAGNYLIHIPIRYKYIKISAKGTGTVTNSSMTIDALLHNV